MLKERFKGAVVGAVVTLALIITVPAFGKAVTTAIQVTYRNIGVSVDGRTIAVEQEPFIFEGRTFLAVRDVADAFGAEIRMNETTNTVEITSRQALGNTTTGQSQSSSATNPNQRPTNPKISREQADQIALDWLKKNGVTGTQRNGGISMDFEENRWVWELERRNRTQEWDFYIDVETGDVVHVDVDYD